MASYPAPLEWLPIFNSEMFSPPPTATGAGGGSTGGITEAQADQRYLRYPIAQGNETLSSIQVDGQAQFMANATFNSTLHANNGVHFGDGTVQTTALVALPPSTAFSFATVNTDANGAISSIANGDTSALVDISSAQTISGQKTFNSTILGTCSFANSSTNATSATSATKVSTSIATLGTGYIGCFTQNSSTQQTPMISAGLKYDFGGSILTANQFDGLASVAQTVATTVSSASQTYFIPFAEDYGFSDRHLSVNSTLNFNPQAGVLGVPIINTTQVSASSGFVGNLNGNATTSTTSNKTSAIMFTSETVSAGAYQLLFGNALGFHTSCFGNSQLSYTPLLNELSCSTMKSHFVATSLGVVSGHISDPLILSDASGNNRMIITQANNSIVLSTANIAAISIDSQQTTRFSRAILSSVGPIISGANTILALPLSSVYMISAVPAANITLPTALGQYAGLILIFRRSNGVNIITFNQTGGASVMVPIGSTTSAVSFAMTAVQVSTTILCDGTRWYQMSVL